MITGFLLVVALVSTWVGISARRRYQKQQSKLAEDCASAHALLAETEVSHRKTVRHLVQELNKYRR